MRRPPGALTSRVDMAALTILLLYAVWFALTDRHKSDGRAWGPDVLTRLLGAVCAWRRIERGVGSPVRARVNAMPNLVQKPGL